MIQRYSPPNFVYDFSRKMFLMLYSINWPNFIVWLPLLLEILGNMCITIICSPGCDVIKFEINLIFLIKLFCCLTEKSRHKFKYLKNEKSFWSEIKSSFHHFKKTFNCQKLSQTWKFVFKNTLNIELNSIVNNNSYTLFEEKFLSVLSKQAPLKTKLLLYNNKAFMSKEFRKSIMLRSKFKNILNKNRSYGNWCKFKRKRNLRKLSPISVIREICLTKSC